MSKIILSENFIVNTCKLALNEDLFPLGDITSSLLKNNIKKKLKLISNQNGVIGGLEFAKQTFKLIDKKLKFKVKKKEGSSIKKGDVIATIEGNIKNILTGERVALNFISHISGIATKTNQFVKKVVLLSNQSGIIGGLEFAKQTFKLIDRKIKIKIKKKKALK